MLFAIIAKTFSEEEVDDFAATDDGEFVELGEVDEQPTMLTASSAVATTKDKTRFIISSSYNNFILRRHYAALISDLLNL